MAGIEPQVGSSVFCGTVLEAVGSRFHLHGTKRGGKGGRGLPRPVQTHRLALSIKRWSLFKSVFRKKGFPICFGALFVPAQGKLRFKLGE